MTDAPPPANSSERIDALVGCILGTAVGDALGLPYEGIGRRRLDRLAPRLERYGLIFGRGMTSDDTEHTCLLAQALANPRGEVAGFERSLAWGLRFWMLGLPAGVGFATLRAIIKLWLGFPPRSSGVFSAGNGAAMRTALIGVFYAPDPGRIGAFVRAATRITHTDPRAEHGALLVAIAALLAVSRAELDAPARLRHLHASLPAEALEFHAALTQIERALADGVDAREFAGRIGCAKGVSGYVLHTVPMALFVYLRHPKDFAGGLREMVRCGGDTDSCGAIVGALIGCSVGRRGIPERWLEDLSEWPRSVAWMARLGEYLGSSAEARARQGLPRANGAALLVRNAFFLTVVLAHGLRRLLPPY